MKRYLRQKVLREFRGYWEPRETRETRQAGDLAGELLDKLGLEDRLAEQDVSEAWREIVGDFLAEHSQPLKLRRGVLTVRVLQPSVHYELDRKWKPQVLAKLQARFGKDKVQSVRFGLG
jgi:predicted nucleic acid-binding Zn ribbon protein